jgi:TolA-binding protein
MSRPATGAAGSKSGRVSSAMRVLVVALGLGLLGLAGAGCTANTAKKHYVLAEKLWTDAKYTAAVAEFDKVSVKDPKGKLGLQALYRSATTQFLFLSQYPDALKKFKAYAEASNADPTLAWDAQKQIGEILYAKTDQYDRSIQHYRMLMQLRKDAPEAPEFMFRIAKSHFFLWQFNEAVMVYRQIQSLYPGSIWAERAMFEVGTTYYTRGERSAESYREAEDAFKKFLKAYPKSDLVSQAQFGIANCLEEKDQLDEAYEAYDRLKKTYPSPNVIAIKLARIRERQEQRSR